MDISELTAEVRHIHEKVNSINNKLEALSIDSRLAVLEDRQNSIKKVVYGIITFLGTTTSGVIIWLITN